MGSKSPGGNPGPATDATGEPAPAAVDVRGLADVQPPDDLGIDDRRALGPGQPLVRPERHAQQPPGGVHYPPHAGQGRDGLRVRGAEQPDAAVGGGGHPVPLVLVGGQPRPGLRRHLDGQAE